jgi:hypothetical protein
MNSDVIHDRKVAIRNTVFYAIVLVLAIAALVGRKSVMGYILVGLIVLWAIGGLTASVRSIRQGFRDF